MDEFISFSVSLRFCFCPLSFLSSLILSVSVCHYPSASLPVSPPPPLFPFLDLSLAPQDFHLDLQTPPPGATLITYGGNRKCGLKSKLKWVFFSLQAVDILVAEQGKPLPEYFSSALRSAWFRLMKRNDVMQSFPF